jgi:hypothetical protein
MTVDLTGSERRDRRDRESGFAQQWVQCRSSDTGPFSQWLGLTGADAGNDAKSETGAAGDQ